MDDPFYMESHDPDEGERKPTLPSTEGAPPMKSGGVEEVEPVQVTSTGEKVKS